MQQRHYVGLDVSQDLTTLCVIDDMGARIRRGTCASEADASAGAVRAHAPNAARIGLETGLLSNFLTRALRQRQLPVVCLDARHAKAALRVQINKTNANDAVGLAQVVRTGWFHEVADKSMDAQTLHMLLVARAQLVGQRRTLANTIRGLLEAFGHVMARGGNGPTATRVRALIAGTAEFGGVIEPLLDAWHALRAQIAVLDRHAQDRAKTDRVVRRLMSVPGVGVVVALAYTNRPTH